MTAGTVGWVVVVATRARRRARGEFPPPMPFKLAESNGLLTEGEI